MKTIKIFLASSEELKEERKELADIVANLNHILSKRDIFVDLVKWEYLDASMGVAHKQEEYNAELRECELCIVLYWTRFGMYTKTELDTAYGELKKEGHNPQKVYVYFKDCENPSEELKAFRDSFPSAYGHFFTNFANIDTLKAHFLLQFMEYMNNHLQVNDVLEIRDSQVKINGQAYVNLANVPFAGNNEEYNRTLQDIKDTKELLSYLPPENPMYSKSAQKLQELEKKMVQMESSLWDTALMVTRLSSTKQSDRLQRAMDLFNSGDNRGAMAVLKEEDIDRDVQHNLHLVELGEEGKKGLKTNIEEYTLRIKTLKNDMAESWGEEVLSLHKKILELAGKIYGEESVESSNYQVDAARDFNLLGMYHNALEIGEKALGIRLRTLGEGHRDVAESYNNVGEICSSLGKYKKALEYVENALQIRLTLFGEHHASVAESYHNVGVEYSHLGDHQKALEYVEKSLQINISIFGESHPDVAYPFYSAGYIYGELGDHKKAQEYLKKALQIRLSVFGERHPVVAWTYEWIGVDYSRQGDNRKALEYMKKALEIRQFIFGELHRDVARTYNNVGAEYGKLGETQKELECRSKGLAIAESIKDTDLIAALQKRVGKVFLKIGETEQAKEYFKHAIEKFKELGNDKEYTATKGLYESCE